HTLPAYGRHSDNLETTVIQLYTKGITTAEIAELTHFHGLSTSYPAITILH
ncbi:hypothetical protein EFM26_10820, partial [Limosilactobacillus fermentum]|nr:hypothetical protein [Limosilactobacillus fermentum]